MNTFDIDRILRYDYRTKRSFRGVFPSNSLPSPSPGLYVINLDPSHKLGSHWVAVHIINQSKAEYFDSYGFPPFVPALIEFLKSFKLTYNSTQLQSFHSDICGEYCCLYVLHKSTRKGLPYFISLFTHPPFLNDCRVLRNFHLSFERHRKPARCNPRSQRCCSRIDDAIHG